MTIEHTPHAGRRTPPRRIDAALLVALVAGCGPTTPAADPCAAATVEVSGAPLRLRAWLASDVPSATVSVTVSPAACEVEVATDATWLTPSLGGGTLSVEGDADLAGPGVHDAELVFTLAGTSTVVGSADVRLSVLERAPADGERHALVIGIDGCRPDALARADAPTLDALTALGRATYTASTQLTAGTISGPGWASILTNVEAEDHLVDGNDDLADVALDAHPTFLARARGAGLEIGLFPQWIGILALVEPEIAGIATVGTGERVARDAAARLGGDVDLVFTHFDDVDHAGHASGFSPENPEYLAAIESVDGHAATMLDAILARPTIGSERWLVAVTTDHGGSGTGHGALDAENRTIFVVLADLGGEPAELPASGVSHMDVGPSVMTHLGMTIEPVWALDGVAR